MSQIHLRVRPNPAHADTTDVVIGWDPPLDTYFLQVHSTDEDRMILWLGTRLRELDLDTALETAARYAVIPKGLRSRLLNDRLDRPSLPPTPFQQAMRRAFGDETT